MKVVANFAMSLDGKINTIENKPFRFGSETDLKNLKTTEDWADAVLVGAKSYRHWPMPLVGHYPNKPKINAILSRSLDLNFSEEYLSHQNLKTIVYTNQKNAQQKKLPVDVVMFLDHDFCSQILSDLKSRGVNKLLLEGGSQIFWQFLKEDFVDEIFITVCPKIFGGELSPSLVGGAGFSQDQIKTLKLLNTQIEGDEVFLHYKVLK